MRQDETGITGQADVRDESVAEEEKGTKTRKSSFARELIEMLVLTLIIFFLIRGVVQSFRVDGQSMETTLDSNELLIVNKAIYWSVPDGSPLDLVAGGPDSANGMQYVFTAPQRGDVIVFRAPPSTGNPGSDYIKRVIGMPGDEVTIKNDKVYVNGKALDEPYVHNEPTIVEPWGKNHWVVPEGEYFVLGDNRLDSSDSRYWGFVPAENIIGKAEFAYWPLDMFGEIPGAFVVAGAWHMLR